MGQPLPHSQEETHLHVCGVMLMPCPEGALWWEAQRTLIVSDLHLEKGSSFAKRGQMLPPYDTDATLQIVEGLVDRLKPDAVISLGDSFHDPSADARMDEASCERVRELTSKTKWIWVEGNHDPDPPAHLGGQSAKVLRIENLVFRHEPSGEVGEISGHLHPKARISGSHRRIRLRCFVTDGHRLVMPALGAFTGGLNVLDDAFLGAFPEGGMMTFAMGEDRVFMVSNKRLSHDGPPRYGKSWRMNRNWLKS